MKRNVSLAEISDGRLYGANDMVKADCHGCPGCSDCCRGMGSSVILDPYDIYRLQAGLGKRLEILLGEGKVEWNVVDGCILPNLKMAGQGEACAFLDPQGRCGIHAFRPGICRLFPLGRYYENGDFKYMLQIHECPAGNRSKVKVSKWIDTPQQGKNHAFLCRWHYLLNDLEALVGTCQDEALAKQVNMALLQVFYLAEYDTERDFYEQFDQRYERFVAAVNLTD
ncbi:MAG: YkgJ family cysteine cluster protein [Blautia sp.]|nr:YkgJ family cysteine cluster protein [Blautia sp.]